MWEWEDQDGDGDNQGTGGLDAGAIIDAQRQDLERRKEAKRIELEINNIIDNRIASYKDAVAITKMELQDLQKLVAAQHGYDKAKRDAVAAHQAALETGDSEAIKAAKVAMDAAEQSAADYKTELQGSLEKMADMENLGPRIKAKIRAAFARGDIDEMNKALAQGIAELDAVQDAADVTASAFGFMAKTAGISYQVSESAFGKMAEGLTKFAVAAAKNPLAALQQGLTAMVSVINPINLAANAMDILKNVLFESETAAIDMTKAFGGGMKDNMKALQDAQVEALKYDVSLKELAKSNIALQGTIAGFNRLNAAQSKQLKQGSMLMAKMGVDEKLLAKETQKLAYSFGGLGDGTTKAQTKIVSFAQAAQKMGYTMAESVQALSNFGGSVASMGGEITTQLKEMMAMSKATGAEMSKLLNIAKKFNTFKQGADMAAQLNSVFGTSISQIELMGKTAPERNKIIAESLNNAVGGYAAMTDHQRLAAAEMLGFGDDVLQLQSYMEGQTEADRLAAEAKAEEAAAMENLRQTAMKMVPALTQLANEFKKAFLESGMLQDMMKWFTDNREQIIAFFKGAADIIRTVADNFAWLTGLYVAGKVAIIAYNIYMTASTAITAAGGTAAAASSAGWGALGSAMWYAMGALVVIVVLFGLLYMAFHKTGSPAFWEIAGYMALGIVALGVAFHFATPALYAAMPAMAALMFGLAAVFYVLPPLVEALGGVIDSTNLLFQTMINGVPQLFQVAAALGAIGLGFVFLGKMAMISALGIGAGTLALVALRATMGLTGTSFKDLESIGKGVHQMGEGMKNLKDGLGGLGAAGGALLRGLGNKNLMVSGDSRGATIVAGKGGLFAFIPPKITVDVNMDDKIQMSAPQVNVTVTIDGDQLRHIISEEIAESR